MKKTKKRRIPKVLFPFYMDVKQFEYLTKKSEETGWSKASIMREWVDKCIEEERVVKTETSV